MKITTKVKIGGIDYTVKNVKELREREDLVGEIVYQDQLIRLDAGLDNDSDFKKQLFVHEIVHGILENCYMKNDEEFVRRFSIGLYDVIKNNPKIFQV